MSCLSSSLFNFNVIVSVVQFLDHFITTQCSTNTLRQYYCACLIFTVYLTTNYFQWCKFRIDTINHWVCENFHVTITWLNNDSLSMRGLLCDSVVKSKSRNQEKHWISCDYFMTEMFACHLTLVCWHWYAVYLFS